MLSDLRPAWRIVLNHPTRLIASLLLGVTLAVSTSVFALTDLLILRPFPFPEPARLLVVGLPSPFAAGRLGALAHHEIEELASRSNVVGVAAFERGLFDPRFAETHGTEEGVEGVRVTPSFFQI